MKFLLDRPWLLSALTWWPLIYMVLFLIVWLLGVGGMVIGPAGIALLEPMVGPDAAGIVAGGLGLAGFATFAVIFPLHALTMAVGFGLLAFYIVHIIKNRDLNDNERVMWVFICLFAGFIGNIIYLRMHILRRGRTRISWRVGRRKERHEGLGRCFGDRIGIGLREHHPAEARAVQGGRAQIEGGGGHAEPLEQPAHVRDPPRVDLGHRRPHRLPLQGPGAHRALDTEVAAYGPNEGDEAPSRVRGGFHRADHRLGGLIAPGREESGLEVVGVVEVPVEAAPGDAEARAQGLGLQRRGPRSRERVEAVPQPVRSAQARGHGRYPAIA